MNRKFLVLLAVAIVVSSILLWERNSLAREGERDFQRLGCTGCHFSGGGPNLTHVVRKHDDAMLTAFISDPEAIYRTRNSQSLNEGFGNMPRLDVTPREVRSIIAYLHELDREAK